MEDADMFWIFLMKLTHVRRYERWLYAYLGI
jgi:hypothetical protein